MKPPAVKVRRRMKYVFISQRSHTSTTMNETGISIHGAAEEFNPTAMTGVPRNINFDFTNKSTTVVTTIKERLNLMPTEAVHQILSITPIESNSSEPFENHPVVHRRTPQIFSDEQEKELTKFVRDASDFYNGMTSKEVRILAYVYGVCNQVDLPSGWRDKHEASFAWCSGFTKRNGLTLVMGSNSN